ncbi:hypothetical protein JDV02_009333 [Purpureocillium takamizusanense]|uniref:DUF7492 domain-containing protein n=1 Tax=Purpureocillium takamizusanense TaxID=2060973 RepID=A0A9Q8QQM3_9HYPO|nr:uncharacterized protein JDV02_009333 [Purpureocillium takamizusanense]UNI23516.1 hypothetical protein JDV02_009333 [Purpureocillium takamizusanense]
MKLAAPSASRRRSLSGGLVVLLASATAVNAHSWIESAFVIGENGSFIGAEGFPRGYMPRTQPGWSDKQAQNLLPAAGTAAYTGDELLNKYPFAADPPHPLLQARPGDRVAVLHLENGHVTLPQNQPGKPLNRGTVYLYGTAQPKPQERLFDVHLRWNADGSGGDARGRLLATRNYDDGQCFQDNHQPLAQERVSKFSGDGASADKELKCQSVVTIPNDAKPGSVYTVYWYWDWPTLNDQKIDLAATKNGLFPWAGSFMRGDKVPDGWTMDAIRVNESYSSVLDIKITDKLPGVVAKEQQATGAQNKNIYNMAVKGQMDNSFDVKVGGAGAGGQDGAGTASAPAGLPQPSSTTVTASLSAPTAPTPRDSQPVVTSPDSDCVMSTSTKFVTMTRTIGRGTAAPPPPQAPTSGAAPISPDANAGSTATVTETVTVPATTFMSTVYVTASARGSPIASCPSQQPGAAHPLPGQSGTQTSTVMVTMTQHIPAKGAAPTTRPATTAGAQGTQYQRRGAGPFRPRNSE